MNNTKYLTQSFTKLMLFTTFILSLQACSDPSFNTGVETTPPLQQTSRIDGKPIVTMDAAQFHSGEAEYLLKVRRALAENGEEIIRALQTKRFSGAQTAAAGFSPIPVVDLYELSGFSSGSGTQSGSLADLSGHLRVTNHEGDIEEYYLSITPHLSPITGNSPAKNRNTQQAATGEESSDNAWIALDVDQFYVTEDENGEEIWPVTIPAQSLSDPEEIIEVTVHEDGDLEWPEEITNGTSTSNSKTVSALAFPEMNYVTADEMEIQDSGDGGTGSSGGGSTSSSFFEEVDKTFDEFEAVEGAFLSLKSIRLHQPKEGSGQPEVLMNVALGDENKNIFKKWAHAFDRKKGAKGGKDPVFKRLAESLAGADIPGVSIAVDAISDFVLQLAIGGEFLFQPHLFSDVILENALNNTDLFDGKNQFTVGADMAIYEVPDINYAGVNYNFTNMKKYQYSALQNLLTGQALEVRPSVVRELETLYRDENDDYFPLVPLHNNGPNAQWKFVLTESDKKYAKFSGKGISLFKGKIRKKDMWVYDMATGRYNFENVQLEAKGHLFGNSDDIYERSGVKNITARNASDRLTRGEIIAAKDNFEYVFTIEGKKVLCSR